MEENKSMEEKRIEEEKKKMMKEKENVTVDECSKMNAIKFLIQMCIFERDMVRELLER